MKIKTITTVTGVNVIHFEGYPHQYYWIKNLSNTTLYISARPNPTAGADDVSELQPKASVAIETDEGTIYILGAGKVEIHNTNSKICPFEIPGTSSGGGSGEENVIEKVKVNGEVLTVASDKSVNIPVPIKTSDLENDRGYINAIPDIYATKEYVGEQLADADNLARTIVTTLPADAEASENTIYMVKVEDTAGADKYEEYMKIDGTLQLIGDTSVDLSGYAKTKDIPDPYILPKATTEILGGVKVDGDTITIDENGVIKCMRGGGSGGSGGDVQADFLTADGFGNLRYYNGHLQYYNKDKSEWIDTSVTPDNVYIVNMTPQAMKSIRGFYDLVLGRNKLKFEEPADTVLDGQVVCVVESVVIRRKLGSAPTDPNDGIFVDEIHRQNFGNHEDCYYIDETFQPLAGEKWYYKAFPMSTIGFYNAQDINTTTIVCKDYELYGFKIDQNESDPASMITYIEDNKNFKPAYMDYASDTFNYGDWKDAFFMQVKPCMLKYDGTVDYYLNPNDYSKREGGLVSDISDDTYDGNVMVQFPKVYWKIVDNGDDTANIYICSKKLDDDFHCWSHIDANGNEIPYCYMSVYDGYSDGTRLRSLSSKYPSTRTTILDNIRAAVANNNSNDNSWCIEVYSDRMLITLLLLLIGKSTDTQIVFGTGNNSSYASSSNPGVKATGILNTKGLFWGNQDNVSCVKVFGMENRWGNLYKHIVGWIKGGDGQKIKMTYGQSDGSTVDGYNITGNGYITIPNSALSDDATGFISKMIFNINGFLPKKINGSSTTYYSDTLLYGSSDDVCPIVGGAPDVPNGGAGIMNCYFCPVSKGYSETGASISCKPLATT